CTRQRGVAQAGRWRRRLQGRTSVTDRRQPYHTGWAGLYPGPGSRLDALQQPSQKLGPLQPAGDQEVLAVGVRTTAVWTQTVEGRDAEGRREVPVAAAPGAGFLQREADLVGDGLRQCRQASDAFGAFHRWPLHAAFGRDLRSG